MAVVTPVRVALHTYELVWWREARAPVAGSARLTLVEAKHADVAGQSGELGELEHDLVAGVLVR
jgi:hypothetical protein